MSFSELLKKCRKKQGISQAELAARLGVTQQAVGKWESGKSSPDPSTVARIAGILGTTADYLLGLYRPAGDSMEPRIQDGDLALVHRQDTLESGDLGVIIYGDEGEGTLKRYIQRGNSVVLQPFNPNYSELVIKGEDLNRLHIAGRVVETKTKW